MPFEIIKPGIRIDFLGKRHIAFAASALLLLASVVGIFVQGIRLGIDFAGGTEVQLRFPVEAGAREGAIREVASACGVRQPTVVRYGEAVDSEFLLSFKEVTSEEEAASGCPLTEQQTAQLAQMVADTGSVEEALGQAAVIERLSMALENRIAKPVILRIEFVGPRVGVELRRDGLRAMLFAFAFILAYIAFRFSTRFAPGAVVALVHDVGITAGIFVMLGLEFDLRVLAALLATLGYSLNDTIIIYDRIRENMELHTKHDLVDVLNRSVNQTLSRTLLTSLTTLAAVLALLFLGGEVIRPFALAMAIGIVVGTYSSTFIAAPTLLYLERRLGGYEEAGKGGGEGAAPPERAKKHPKQRERDKAARARA